MIKRILRILGLAILLVLLYVVIVLVHGTLTDYQPEAVIQIESDQNGSPEPQIADSLLSFMIWNLGYGGLGAESNFFYDKGGMFFSGGRMVRSSESLVTKNVDGILTTIQENPADFYLLQEVDFNSKRSYGINEYEQVMSQLDNYQATFAPNYKAPRVPLPIFEPWKAYGRVLSGLASYSRFSPTDSKRLQLPGSFPWPTRVFQLDRCAEVQRYPTSSGKELIVVNVHNSAYDSGGALKKQQMDFLRELLLEAYEAGNYVIVGGDWNQCPPFFKFDSFVKENPLGYTQINIDPAFLPDDWKWVYDPTIPTNRKAGDIYKPGETFETLIDFFLISPNVQALSVRGIPLKFAFSDHQPVFMEVLLKDFSNQ
ncbi:MAG: endonuclease/exonuclease/phosphatase family protein [Saprospiraceae bacterium]|nr:endonuclease/exonuclease/phosphatase family protein [Saprospiraceae bacterium]